MRSVPLPETMCLSTARARVSGVRYSAVVKRLVPSPRTFQPSRDPVIEITLDYTGLTL